MDLSIFQEAPAYMQISIMALVTYIVVQGVKIFIKKYKDRDWHDAAVITAAFVVAVIVSLLARVANVQPLDAATGALIVLQSVIIGLLATGGHEWLSKAWGIVSGAVSNRGTIFIAGDNVEANISGVDTEVDTSNE